MRRNIVTVLKPFSTIVIALMSISVGVAIPSSPRIALFFRRCEKSVDRGISKLRAVSQSEDPKTIAATARRKICGSRFGVFRLKDCPISEESNFKTMTKN